MAFPEDPPSTLERRAIHNIAVAIKRFWHASTEADERRHIDELINSIIKLAKETK